MRPINSFADFCFTAPNIIVYSALNILVLHAIRYTARPSIIDEIIVNTIVAFVLLGAMRHRYRKYTKTDEFYQNTLSDEEFARVLKALRSLGTSYSIGDVLLSIKVTEILRKHLKWNSSMTLPPSNPPEK